MEGAEADVPRKESSNNSTQMAEGHCTRAAGRRAPTHRPSPRAGRGAITWDLKIRDRNGIRLHLVENGTQEPAESLSSHLTPRPLSAESVNQPEETWWRGGGTTTPPPGRFPWGQETADTGGGVRGGVRSFTPSFNQSPSCWRGQWPSAAGQALPGPRSVAADVDRSGANGPA